MLAYPDGLDQQSASVQWADWLELCLLFSASTTLSRSAILEIFELRHGDPDDAASIMDFAFADIAHRQRMLGDAYPFENHGGRVTLRRPRDECIGFSFLLALGTRHFFSAVRVDDESARLFEFVVATGIARYLNGRALRIGARREPPVPTPFSECLAYLGKQLGEARS